MPRGELAAFFVGSTTPTVVLIRLMFLPLFYFDETACDHLWSLRVISFHTIFIVEGSLVNKECLFAVI